MIKTSERMRLGGLWKVQLFRFPMFFLFRFIFFCFLFVQFKIQRKHKMPTRIVSTDYETLYDFHYYIVGGEKNFFSTFLVSLIFIFISYLSLAQTKSITITIFIMIFYCTTANEYDIPISELFFLKFFFFCSHFVRVSWFRFVFSNIRRWYIVELSLLNENVWNSAFIQWLCTLVLIWNFFSLPGVSLASLVSSMCNIVFSFFGLLTLNFISFGFSFLCFNKSAFFSYFFLLFCYKLHFLCVRVAVRVSRR